MLVVNILSSSLYLPLVLLSALGGEGDSGEVAALQELLFQSVAHCIGALSVLSTLCTGILQFCTVELQTKVHEDFTITKKALSFVALSMLYL